MDQTNLFKVLFCKIFTISSSCLFSLVKGCLSIFISQGCLFLNCSALHIYHRHTANVMLIELLRANVDICTCSINAC